MNKGELALRYAIFAVISTVFNLSIQYSILFFYKGSGALYVAIFLGTLGGLFVKYVLDKKFIFYYQIDSQMMDLQKFIFYSAMGVVTTLIFWFFELGFNYFLKFENAKFIGAFIGLSIGYFIKYKLDKKFVFIKQNG